MVGNYMTMLGFSILLVLTTVKAEELEGFKRHFVQGGESTIMDSCAQTCGAVQNVCRNTCYGQSGSKGTPFSTTIINGSRVQSVLKDDSRIYQCFAGCLHSEEIIVRLDDRCQTMPASKDKPESDDEDVIELSKLTTAERCKLPAFQNSTVCKFELNYPEAAQLMFKETGQSLSACAGSPVIAGVDGLYTKDTLEEFGKRGNELAKDPEDELTRRKRTLSSGLMGRIRRSQTRPIRERNEIGNDQHYDNSDERCPTVMRRMSPARAIHIRSKLTVDLYFHANYSQWFEIGRCKEDKPRISEVGDSECKVKKSGIFASVVVDNTEENAKNFSNCLRTPNVPYLVCRDWILLDSRCSHVAK